MKLKIKGTGSTVDSVCESHGCCVRSLRLGCHLIHIDPAHRNLYSEREAYNIIKVREGEYERQKEREYKRYYRIVRWSSFFVHFFGYAPLRDSNHLPLPQAPGALTTTGTCQALPWIIAANKQGFLTM